MQHSDPLSGHQLLINSDIDTKIKDKNEETVTIHRRERNINEPVETVTKDGFHDLAQDRHDSSVEPLTFALEVKHLVHEEKYDPQRDVLLDTLQHCGIR